MDCLSGDAADSEAGWLLDVYVKDKQAIHRQPQATFMFQPKGRAPGGTV